MKFTITATLALSAAVLTSPAAAQQSGAAPAAAAAQAQPEIKLSKRAGKAIIELQTAVNAKDMASIPAKLAAAKAVAQSPDDRYAIGRLQLTAARASNDTQSAIAAVDTIAASNFAPKSQVAGLYNSLGVDLYNAKNTAGAAALFQKALAVDPNNAETLRLLAEAQNASGNPTEAIAAFQRAMQQATASGQKLPEDSYKRAVSVAFNAKSPSAVTIARQWIEAYPNPESWRNAVAIYRNMMHPPVQGTLDLLRLQRATNSLTTTGEYALYAAAASEQGLFAEANAVLSEGIANKRASATDRTVRETLEGLKTKPKATAADLNAALKMSPKGSALVKIGDGFFGLGDYSRAAEVYRQAQAAGADANLANLHLGMALARAGDKAGATAAFNAVTGANADIAKYWLIYVNRAA